MRNKTRVTAAIVLSASAFACLVSNANANTAADNVRLSAVPLKDGAFGNECTNRSIRPFARPKDSTFSDDALRAGLTLLTGTTSGGYHLTNGDYHSGPPNVCGDRSAF